MVAHRRLSKPKAAKGEGEVRGAGTGYCWEIDVRGSRKPFEDSAIAGNHSLGAILSISFGTEEPTDFLM